MKDEYKTKNQLLTQVSALLVEEKKKAVTGEEPQQLRMKPNSPGKEEALTDFCRGRHRQFEGNVNQMYFINTNLLEFCELNPFVREVHFVCCRGWSFG